MKNTLADLFQVLIGRLVTNRAKAVSQVATQSFKSL